MTKLYYNYSELDKEHVYQVTGKDKEWPLNFWVWFYLGKYLKLRKNERLLPYWFEGDKLAEYKINGAERRAKFIVACIERHRKKRGKK